MIYDMLVVNMAARLLLLLYFRVQIGIYACFNDVQQL